MALAVNNVAERWLELRTETRVIKVIASLARPREVGPEEWTCELTVRFGDAVQSMTIHGVDSLQALQLAMVTLDAELQHGASKHGGKLFHLDEPFNSVLEHSGMQPSHNTKDP